MAITKAEVAKLVATGGRGQLEARMRILQDVGGYIAQTPDAPPPLAPVAAPPAAGAVSNPPPPVSSIRERVAALQAAGDSLGARALLLTDPARYLSGEADPVTPAAPIAK